MASTASPSSPSATGAGPAKAAPDAVAPDSGAPTAFRDVPALPVENRGLLTVGVMAAVLMQILDATIANVALPHMQTSLGATSETVTWVLTSYIVAAAIATPVTGWLAERLGSRNLFLIATGGFVIASMLCGMAFGLTEMVLFRVAQGIFGAFLGPLSQTVMMDINKPSQQGKAMSIWGMGIMIGPVAGPLLGGWLTENYNWRWVFYVNVPVGVITFALLWALLPSRPKTERSFDGVGFSMLALGLAAFQLMLDRGQSEDWWQSAEILIEGGVAIAMLWMVIIHFASAKQPLFERSLFKDRNLVMAGILMTIIGMTVMTPMALLPAMLQTLFNYPVIDTGLVLAPRGVGTFTTMALSGYLMGKVDTRWMIISGILLSALSMYLMAHWNLEISQDQIIMTGFLQGLGMGLVFMPVNALAFATLPQRFRTDGASLMNLLRSLGGAVGISIATTLLAQNAQTAHEKIGANVTQQTIASLNAYDITRFGAPGQSVVAMVNAEVTKQAYMIAYLNDFYLMAGISLLAIPLVFLLKTPKGKMEIIHAE